LSGITAGAGTVGTAADTVDTDFTVEVSFPFVAEGSVAGGGTFSFSFSLSSLGCDALAAGGAADRTEAEEVGELGGVVTDDDIEDEDPFLPTLDRDPGASWSESRLSPRIVSTVCTSCACSFSSSASSRFRHSASFCSQYTHTVTWRHTWHTHGTHRITITLSLCIIMIYKAYYPTHITTFGPRSPLCDGDLPACPSNRPTLQSYMAVDYTWSIQSPVALGLPA
jgi:hypothetical protein